jgi:hypothetical protein
MKLLLSILVSTVCCLSGCAVVTVASATVSVAALAVKAGATVVGTGVDVAAAGVRAVTGSNEKNP